MSYFVTETDKLTGKKYKAYRKIRVQFRLEENLINDLKKFAIYMGVDCTSIVRSMLVNKLYEELTENILD